MQLPSDTLAQVLGIHTGNPLQITIPATAVWWVFGIVIGIYALISLALVYHWGKYSYRPIKTGFVAGIYFSGSLVLVTIMFLNILTYLSTL